ncbi:MAG: glucodextranase DOMON-like domain-containing protein [Acidobacteriota bacterium]|nr:glucodextranase DOMON-like domain-containing protein [Acidobacteriota bacterium]
MQKRWMSALVIALIACLIPAGSALADVTFSDPTGDDHGPGDYVYPTDAVYTRGSFDLTELKVETKGKRATFEVSVNGNVEDPWGMDTGFSIQMVFIFIDTDGKEGSGHTDSPPGLNVTFGPSDAWDKVIILSPQPFARVKQEVEAKAAGMAEDIIVPSRTSGGGRSISGQVKLAEIGEGDPATWGYQVVMQSNEGFPAEGDLLTRKVNEFEGQHRFGGGTDYDCDPHAIDVLGDADQLKYKCAADGTAEEMAVLKMMRQ